MTSWRSTTPGRTFTQATGSIAARRQTPGMCQPRRAGNLQATPIQLSDDSVAQAMRSCSAATSRAPISAYMRLLVGYLDTGANNSILVIDGDYLQSRPDARTGRGVLPGLGQ